MGLNYSQLTYEERIQIKSWLQENYSIRTIADRIKRSPSTICREIKRNSGKRGYRYRQAQKLAVQRQKNAQYRKLTPKVIDHVEQKLAEKLSPEQISNTMIKDAGCRISHERIYQHVYIDKAHGGTLYKSLRINFKRRYRRSRDKKNWRSRIPDRIDIDERPSVVNERKRFGDWEADLVCGNSYIVTLVERKSRLTLIGHVENKTAKDVGDEIIKLLKPYRDLVHTITYDNGNEFAQHKRVNMFLGCESYFAKPYHSWERGANENTNGLIRQYFPKAEKLSNVSMRKITFVQDQLNNRPRKCLDYKTPLFILQGAS